MKYKEKSATVYMAVNKVNGKKYIGITSQPFQNRKTRHKYDALVKNHQFYFHRAIRKYGFDNFEWLVAAEFDKYKDALNAEIKLIKFFGNGYNMTKGGEGILGRKISQEQKEIVSKTQKGNTHWKGRNHRPESIKKISDSRLGRDNPSVKKIICLDTGEIFDWAGDISDRLGVLRKSVTRVCRGERPTIKGLRFKYLDEVA